MKQLLLLSFTLCFSLNGFSWGQTGHRVIGQIAETHLSRKAKKEIAKILGNESLATASTWMDEVRSDSLYDHTHDWHWVTIPDGQTYDESEKNPNGDLVEAIERMIDSLESKSVSLDEKKKYLRYLVHLIGDLHQPLHVGRGDDRGGNDIKIKWFYDQSNLHRIWDSEMIDEKQLSYSELATAINHPEKQQVRLWQHGNAVTWAHEAMQYRPQVYAIGDKDYLSYGYMYHSWPLVEEQLLKAGVRLAGVLNNIFA